MGPDLTLKVVSVHPNVAPLSGGIIVSVQAEGEEPLNRLDHLLALAQSALNGGAIGLRTAQISNIKGFHHSWPTLPLIGLTKSLPPECPPLSTVYITPTLEEALAVAKAGASIVALDATQRGRPDGQSLAAIISGFKKIHPDKALMADIATVEDGLAAAALGVDVISTTLSGYTQETQPNTTDHPDFELLKALVTQVPCPVILEGRVWCPEDVAQGFSLGAYGVVVGSAVTRPQLITRRFVAACPSL